MKNSDVIPETAVKLTTAAENTNRSINDLRFIDQLREVFKLKQFLFEEKVSFNPDQLGSIDLGSLNSLEFGRQGRLPTDDEWKLLDQKLANLSSYLDDGLRQKFRIRQLSIFFGVVPLTFLLVTALSTVAYFMYPYFLTGGTWSYNLCYYITMIVWTIAQGGLGACAYLAVQATKRGSTATVSSLLKESFEITDSNVLKIRIVLGSLFAFILGIAFTYRGLNTIYELMNPGVTTASTGSQQSPVTGSQTSPIDVALTLVPFLLGFSTTLVLAIVERLIDSVKTFFGITSSTRSD